MSSSPGFLGTKVEIADINITGRTLKYKTFFRDEEGRTHAYVNHEIVMDDETPFSEPVRLLVEACRAHSIKLHFEPHNESPRQVARGIAESLSLSPDPIDEPGESG